MILFVEALERRVLFTAVGISGSAFTLDGILSNAGSAMQGLLPNVRAVQATFDDANPATVGTWAYPDTHQWDASRNLNEFIAALPSWRAHGVRAVTLNFQGGSPKPGVSGPGQPWDESAYNPDGTFRPAALARMGSAIQALDQNGMVAIVGLFYAGQDYRLGSDAAVTNAATNATDWLVARPSRNVLVEVANESSSNYAHAALWPQNVASLVKLVQARSGGALKVSTSFRGGIIPPDDVLAAEDFALLHGNGQTAAGLTAMVAATRAKTGKPIIFNEDSTYTPHLDAVTSIGVSWGYYEQGLNNYRDGFQSLAVNWTINTPAKQAFFDDVARLSTVIVPPITGPGVTGFALVDATRGVVVGPLLDGDTITLAQFGSDTFNVIAYTSPSTTGSVQFGLDSNGSYHLENSALYTLCGNPDNTHFYGFRFSVGLHSITATAFSGANRTGLAGAAVTVRFTVV